MLVNWISERKDSELVPTLFMEEALGQTIANKLIFHKTHDHFTLSHFLQFTQAGTVNGAA